MSQEIRKSYCIKPKIEIPESSDSILKTVIYSDVNGLDFSVENNQLNLGVWTKVTPQKTPLKVQRRAYRAHQIIQENSAILKKILSCETKKKLHELEEIRQEIAISPINEEVSKIFSPILEKIGFNESDIDNEFCGFKTDKDTNVDKKNNLYLWSDKNTTDENCEVETDSDYDSRCSPNLVGESLDYFLDREKLIDEKINQELSKLLTNYEISDKPSTFEDSYHLELKSRDIPRSYKLLDSPDNFKFDHDSNFRHFDPQDDKIQAIASKHIDQSSNYHQLLNSKSEDYSLEYTRSSNESQAADSNFEF